MAGYRDTRDAYGRVTRALHWAVALLFAWLMVTVATKLSGSQSDAARQIWSTHYATGFSIFVLGSVRLLWAVASRRSRPAPAAGPAGLAARSVHAALYLLTVAVPLIAILRAYGSGRGLTVFGVQAVPGAAEKSDFLVRLGGLLHGELGLALIALVLGHVGAALFHAARRDGRVSAMFGRSGRITEAG